MMEAERTSETSVDNYFTLQYIPEDNSELHTRRRENFKFLCPESVHSNHISIKCRYISKILPQLHVSNDLLT
jgi:hypothetical protein